MSLGILYVFAQLGRRVEKAINEERFSKKIMDKDYENIMAEIQGKVQDLAEMARMMHEFHNERVAELVRTSEEWLNKPDEWPIKINQFNQVIAGNHRISGPLPRIKNNSFVSGSLTPP